jgi:hypothetical protein
MKARLSLIAVSILLLAGISLAQQSGYQPGKIISVQKQDAPSARGGTDAPSKSSDHTYHMDIETGGKTYTVVYKGHSDLDPSWKEGKDVEAEVKGKTMSIKMPGGKGLAKLAIVSSK